MDPASMGLEMKQLFFNTLMSLGFDAHAMEAVHHIPFNKSMFELPNKRGAEIVLHFLFQRLNPTMCKEAFRDSWPILDKKREQAFRKTCCNWLTNILQEEPESHLPRINASLFMSPGGEKFYQLLFYFTAYVLQKVMQNELGVKHADRLKCPNLTSQNQSLADAILKSLKCSSVRHRKQYLSAIQLNVKANKTWKDTTDDYVKEYRKLSKDVRELDYKIRDEEQKNIQAAMARGSPVKKRGAAEKYDPENDPRTIKRSQRIQLVRDMWKQLEDYDRCGEAEREVVASIVEKTINKHQLDAANIDIKVPDMLLRECQDEIRRRNVDNTYQGGNLNLVSVLQLWNLSLQLYSEKLKQVGLPKFDKDIERVTQQVHIHQDNAHKAQQLRQRMGESIPELKSSVEQLRCKLDSVLFREQSPESIRTTSVGLGLMRASPQVDFSPRTAITPAGGVGVTSSPKRVLDTPEAAQQIADKMRNMARKGPDKLFTNTDLTLKDKSIATSAIPKPRSTASSRQSSRPNSGRSTTSTSSRGRGQSAVKSKQHEVKRGRAGTISTDDTSFQKIQTPRTLVQDVAVHADTSRDMSAHVQAGRQNISVHSDFTDTSLPLSSRSDTSSMSDKTLTARSDNSTPRSPASSQGSSSVKGQDVARSDNVGRKTAVDILVSEIMGEGEILANLNSGMEAFESRGIIRRTPDLEEGNINPVTPPNSETAEIVPFTPPNSETADMPPEICTTPPNSDNETKYNQEDDDAVDVSGPVLEMDALGHVSQGMLRSPRDGLGVSAAELHDSLREVETFMGTELIEDPFRYKASTAAAGVYPGLQGVNNEVLKSADSIVNEMIQEGIRQATEDGADSDDNDPYNVTPHTETRSTGKPIGVPNMGANLEYPGRPEENLDDESKMNAQSLYTGAMPLRSNVGNCELTGREVAYETMFGVDNEGGSRSRVVQGQCDSDDDDGGFDVVTGPDLPDDGDDDDEDDVGSERSTGEMIVIDRSIHMSPQQHHTEIGEGELRVGLDSPFQLLDNETFPSWDNSPRQAIIIDRSFQYTPLNRNDEASSPRGALSRSLVGERTPLSDDIRKMFQRAVADTPPRASPKQVSVPDFSDDLELPNMDPVSRYGNQDIQDNSHNDRLQKADISWDLTENLNDMELPDIDIDKSDLADLDPNKSDLHLGEGDLSIGVNNEKDDSSVPDMMQGMDVDWNDFFTSKTPELPSRQAQEHSVTGSSLTELGQFDLERSLDASGLRAQSPVADSNILISFTP